MMSVLAERRARAEAHMVDTCTVRRITRGAFNELTGAHAPDVADTVYSGRCLARPAGESSVVYGERPITVRRFMVLVPVDAAGIEPDDVLTVDTSDDDELVGTSLRIVDVDSGSLAVRRALICEENEG